MSEIKVMIDGKCIGDLPALALMISGMQSEIARLRETLAIFVHAHATGNSVPPHIEEQAKRLLPPGAEAISRAGQFTPPEATQEQKCTERESGLRTERVTLEITHSEFFVVREWSWQTILRLLRGESVRVVEEFGAALPSVVEHLSAEIKRLDAALAEKASVAIPSGWMNRERDSQWVATLEKVGIKVKGVGP